VIYLLGSLIGEVDNLGALTGFVLLAYSFFFFGYSSGLPRGRIFLFQSEQVDGRRVRFVRRLILLGSLYFIVWGVNQINDFSGGDFSTIADRLTNPGAAYSAKFDVYEDRAVNDVVNRVTQVLILLSIFYALLIPMLIVYWRFIHPWLRKLAVFSIIVYVVSFLYIGTQKGVGDVILLSSAGFAISAATNASEFTNGLKRKLIAGSLGAILLIFGYMALNQSSRAAEFGLTSSVMVGDVSNTWIGRTFGEPVALGVYVALGYPSHGYLGLSYDLKQDFVFSNGAGLSQAYESYRYQFLGGEPNSLTTYPMRTEAATGWPAGMYWSTAFPWFASDLSFPGTVIFMFCIGYLFARVWLRCLTHRDVLAFGALGQLFIFIAFLPANNQVLMQRQGLWVVISLAILAFLRKIARPSL
jgi:hypothetical protein